jgi:predicted enzyme related to lactoylglutathione lyase
MIGSNTDKEQNMTNKIWHIELATTDKPASAQFYSELFGWPFQTYEDMNYTMTDFAEGDTSLAFSPVDEAQGVAPGSVLAYVDVAEVDAIISKAKELGAAIFMDKMEIPGVGWMTIIGDPGGNRIAAMQRMQSPAE